MVSVTKIRNKVEIPIQGRLGSFITFHDLGDSKEHIAIGLGPWESLEAPLIRIHSECLTGDIFGSGRCDCGEQLQESLERLESQGGLLLYLRQEGRGIGLYNKLDAYVLQQRGLDTYEANRMLGFQDDLRNYDVAARMLGALGIRQIRLLSNNPDKKEQIEKHGILVKELVSTGVFLKAENHRYLEAKVRKTGHKIDLQGEKNAV